MPITHQLVEPLANGFDYAKRETIDDTQYIRISAQSDTGINAIVQEPYYTFGSEPMQYDTFYDFRFVTIVGVRATGRSIEPYSSTSIAANFLVYFTGEQYNVLNTDNTIYTGLSGDWVHFYDKLSNYRIFHTYILISRNDVRIKASASECFDQDNKPIQGYIYYAVDEMEIDYRQWIITNPFETEELSNLTALPDFAPPVPNSMWREENGKITHGIELEEVSDFEEPLPFALWRYDTTQEVCPYCTAMRGTPVVHHVFHRLLPNHLPPPTFGAFTNAESLRRVIIPESVKTIGSNSFQNTALKRVRIAADCTYNTETTFPVGCKVNFYPDSNCAQLYDSSGKAVLDCNAARIFVKRSEENG